MTLIHFMSKESFFEEEEFEAYVNAVKKFNSEQWSKDMDHKLFMNGFVAGDYDPGIKILDENKNDFGVFLSDDKDDEIVTIEQEQNHYEGISFGFIDCFARVSSHSRFLSGTLLLRYDPKKLGTVDRDSLHLFKWDKNQKFFQLIEQSGAGTEGEYVWARISSPGIYAAIGLNTDPAKMTMLRIISSTLCLLDSLKPEVQKIFLYNIAKMIIPSDPICEALKDGTSLLGSGVTIGDEG